MKTFSKDIDVNIPLISLTVRLDDGGAGSLLVSGISLSHRAQHGLLALLVKEIVLTAEGKISAVSSIEGVVSFGDSVDLSDVTLADVRDLSLADDTFVSSALKSVCVHCHIDNISIQYGHRLANLILEFGKLYSNTEAKPKRSKKKLEKDKSAKMKISCAFLLDSADIQFVLPTRITKVGVTEVSLVYGEMLEANVNGFSVVQLGSDQKTVVSAPNSVMTLRMEDGVHLLTLGDLSVTLDFAFWTSLLSYVQKSPFLMSTKAKEKPPKDKQVEKKERKQQAVSIVAPALHVVIPTTDGNTSGPLLHVHTGFQITRNKDRIELAILSFSLHFSGPRGRVHYRPIIADFRAVL